MLQPGSQMFVLLAVHCIVEGEHCVADVEAEQVAEAGLLRPVVVPQVPPHGTGQATVAFARKLGADTLRVAVDDRAEHGLALLTDAVNLPLDVCTDDPEFVPGQGWGFS